MQRDHVERALLHVPLALEDERWDWADDDAEIDGGVGVRTISGGGSGMQKSLQMSFTTVLTALAVRSAEMTMA